MRPAWRESQGARETPLPFRAGGFVSCQRCTALYLASMSVPVGNRVASMATDPGLPGRRNDAVLIRDGDHSASGIAPLAVRDGMTGHLAIRECAEHHHRQLVLSGDDAQRAFHVKRTHVGPRGPAISNKGVRRVQECTLEPGRTHAARENHDYRYRQARTIPATQWLRTQAIKPTACLLIGQVRCRTHQTQTLRTRDAARASTQNGIRATTARRKRS